MNKENTVTDRTITERIQVHIPYRLLRKSLDKIVTAGINPEIFLDGDTLDNAKHADLREVYEVLHGNGRTITVHGPYMDLSPGGADEKMRLATVDRYRQTFEVVSLLKAKAVVLHAGYDERRFDGDVELWLGQSLKTWPEFIKEAELLNTVIAVENVFEDGPAPLKALIESLSSPNFRTCLDAGHQEIFSKVEMEEWFRELGRFVAEVHIHDNRGRIDDHLPVGEGAIDFQQFFRLLKHYTRDPIYTIEPHGEEGLWRGVEALKRFL